MSDQRSFVLPESIEEFEVVVVGAGPGGLSTAAALGSYGVETLVVDRRGAPSTLPRATVASTGTMELLRRWGLEERAWERAVDVEWLAWACETLAAAGEGEPVEVGLPTRAQARLISPTAPACIGQDQLEPLLEGHVRSFATVRLEREVELVALDRRKEGGYLLSLGGPGGRRRCVHADYVVGADGLRSKVRAELGIEWNASDDLADRVAVVFRAPLWDLAKDHRYGIYFLSQERSFIPAGVPDRWIFGTAWDGSTVDFESATPEDAKRWIRDAAGETGLPVEIERLMSVKFGVGLAERFRQDEAFLVGDAAHRVTPRGGTGMNTAIRDGFDVGWKLGWVIRGWARQSLLDSYEQERRPVAEFNAERSTRDDGSLLGTNLGLGADIGGRVPHVWVERDGGLVSTLDLVGDGLTLFAGPDWDGLLPSGISNSPPSKVERLDEIAARGLGLMPGGALLVRPDAYPIDLWSQSEYAHETDRKGETCNGQTSTDQRSSTTFWDRASQSC